ncbi:MAG: flavin reductase family protein [Acaryochloridaceae cyanobacterium SU_2_1]|nr:flavin reductase family protein [Acaryochloridaceae cyanobacterium SU_2_1]NJM95068.1 flavin reductase family protein [Acaryochloridaceae cyanobacterium CSU_5_19]
MLDEKAKRTLLRNIPHPLNICGVKEGDQVNGFTLSWMTQASFKPPLIAIGVRQDSRSHAMLKASQVFAVSFLEVTQQTLAEAFFKPQEQVGNKFGEVEFYLGEATGCPIITEALGYIECQVKGSLEEGDHSLFVGEVIAAAQHRQGQPLWLKDTPWQYGG